MTEEIDIIALDLKIKRELPKPSLDFYILDTGVLVRKYKQILASPIKMSFCKKKGVSSDTPPASLIEKQNIINEYLTAAKKYYKITIPNIPKSETSSSSSSQEEVICTNCNNTDRFEHTDNFTICINCGMEIEWNKFSTSYKDSSRANMNARYTYDRRVHFKECINQYQGKQNCTIEGKVYEDLEDQFRKHHLLVDVPSSVTNSEQARHIKFSNIQKSHILMFLKELKYAKHYENLNLIHYVLTGKHPDNISHLEDHLMADFDMLIAVYDKKFKNKINRTNFISTSFVLYQLLQRHGYPCKKEDFIMLKTSDRKNFHNDICKEIFMDLGWNFKSS